MLTLVENCGPEDPVSSSSLTIQDPRDGSTLWTVPTATDHEIATALSEARCQVVSWRAEPSQVRVRALLGMANALDRERDELVRLVTSETGRSEAEAHAGISEGVATLRQYAVLGIRRQDLQAGSTTALDYSVPEARGVVVALTPWNNPVAITASLVGAAVVTGNVVVHKPSEYCPQLGVRLGELLSEELPVGVLSTVIGGAGVGSVLAASSGVDVLAHVGSTASGRRVAAAALVTGAHVILENGGNDALLIDEDVDPAWAAEQAATGAFTASGQSLNSVERIFVHEAVADAFLVALVEQARTWNDRFPLAPLITADARLRLHRRVATSRAMGATLLQGGVIAFGSGSYYPATVLSGCPLDSPLMTEETFGPIAAVHVVDDFEIGLTLAAIDRYGRAATVLSGSAAHIDAAVIGLPVGTVRINSVLGAAGGATAQPRGDSGAGFGRGPELLDELTTRKVVQWGHPRLR